jgi:hypothetical protein
MFSTKLTTFSFYSRFARWLELSKTYADRRICQIILHAVSTERDEAAEFEGMGLIRILSYDGHSMATPYYQHLVGRHEVVTYGEHNLQFFDDDDVSCRDSTEKFDFVASQVIVEGDQGCKIRFRPQSASSASDLIMTSHTHLQFCCTQPSGPRYSATMPDNVIIEPDAHQGEERRVILSQLGSSFAIQRRIAQADNDTAAALSTFTELPFPQPYG